MGRWPTDHDFGALVVDRDRNIVSAPSVLLALGIDDSSAGHDLASITDRIAQHDGRPVWLLGTDTIPEQPGHDSAMHATVVRTFALSPTATRGTPGTISRTVEVQVERSGDPSIAHVLIALIAQDSTDEQATQDCRSGLAL